MMKEWPTTQPISEAAKYTSLRWISNMFDIVKLSATIVPPVSRTIPLGYPVVPEVSTLNIKKVSKVLHRI